MPTTLISIDMFIISMGPKGQKCPLPRLEELMLSVYLCGVQDMDSHRLFASVLNTEQDAPDVIWNKSMRQRLLDHLTGELEPYVRAHANDPMAPYLHKPRPRIDYPELVGKFLINVLAGLAPHLAVTGS